MGIGPNTCDRIRMKSGGTAAPSGPEAADVDVLCTDPSASRPFDRLEIASPLDLLVFGAGRRLHSRSRAAVVLMLEHALCTGRPSQSSRAARGAWDSYAERCRRTHTRLIAIPSR